MLRATGTWAQFNQTERAANGQRARVSAGTRLGVRVSAYGFQRTGFSARASARSLACAGASALRSSNSRHVAAR
jgi:hypothetical protein